MRVRRCHFRQGLLSTEYVDSLLAPFRQQKMLKFTPAQSRAARALLDWTQPKLAKSAALGLSTVVDFERARRAVSPEALAAIRAALELAGVIFVDENGEGPGVRLRKTATGAKAASIPIEDLNAENDE